MHYDHIQVPEGGEAITANTDHSLNVPDRPIIPYVEGDGIGVDVTPVMLDVVNAAVSKAYGNEREIKWMQVYAGQRATEVYGGELYMLAALLVLATSQAQLAISAALRISMN